MGLPAVLAAHAARKLVDPRLAAVLGCASVIGSGATAAAVARVGREEPELRAKLEDGLRWGFAAIMIGLGARMFRSARTAVAAATQQLIKK